MRSLHRRKHDLLVIRSETSFPIHDVISCLQAEYGLRIDESFQLIPKTLRKLPRRLDTAGLKPLAQHMEAISTGSMRRLRADESVGF